MIRRIQGLLQRIYDLPALYRVEDFLVTDRQFLEAVEGAQASEVRERLLVAEGPDGLEVSLYLDQSLVDSLERLTPFEAVTQGHLDAFCTALEGVSHFLYLAWNSRHDRAIRRMEMELQAEVDKFVAAAFLVAARRDGRVPATLYGELFERFRWQAGVDGELGAVYRPANAQAARYCRGLIGRFLRPGSQGMVRELRRFYRLTSEPKLRFIRSAA